MSRPTILLCITKSVWGGAQRYVFDLATALPKEQFSIAVAAGGDGRLFDKLQEKNIRAIRVPSLERDIRLLNEFRVLRDLFYLYKTEKPDIVHLNSSKMGGLGAIAARMASLAIKKKIKVIFTAHGWAFNEDRGVLQNTLIYCATWFSSFFQDHIIVINSRDLRIAQAFIPPKKLSCIFNGIAAPVFFPQEHARNHLAGKINKTLDEQTLVIGAIAELTKNKGITHLIRAASRLNTVPTFHTVIIGGGEEREALRAEIEAHRMQENFSLAGFIGSAAEYLKGFDIFVLPSTKEGLPYVILEAMHAGVPVVATDVGGVSDLIEHKKTGFLVPPKSPGHLTAAIKRLATDKKLRENLSTNAQNLLKQKFRLTTMIKKTITLYLR